MVLSKEGGLDYAFLKLGMDDDSVNHPIMMSEKLCTPLANRRRQFDALSLYAFLMLLC